MSGDLVSEIESAAAAVRRHEVIGLPTDTVYGIGADPFDLGAAARLFAAKARPADVALPVLVASPAEALELAVVGDAAAALIERFWPGPLTLVLWRRTGAASGTPARELHLGGDRRTVGLRCPRHDVALELLRATGPLAVTSANPHGEAPATTAAELRRALGSAVSVVVDGGRCDGEPSTVVSLTGDGPDYLRGGSISREEIEQVLGAS